MSCPAGRIVKCPKCHNLHRFMTCLSGNTFGGAQIWSDGVVVSEMMPEVESPIIRCRYGSCDEIYWKDDAEVFAEVPYPGLRPEYRNEEEEAILAVWEKLKGGLDILSEEDFYTAIDRRICGEDVDKWKDLRSTVWHAMNNPFRQLKEIWIPVGVVLKLSARARHNLESLAELMDVQDPEERLQKAELLRELGRFGEAVALLETEFGWEDWAARTAATLRKLALKGDTLVRVVHDDRGRTRRQQPLDTDTRDERDKP